jgi:hypothetical protein
MPSKRYHATLPNDNAIIGNTVGDATIRAGQEPQPLEVSLRPSKAGYSYKSTDSDPHCFSHPSRSPHLKPPMPKFDSLATCSNILPHHGLKKIPHLCLAQAGNLDWI